MPEAACNEFAGCQSLSYTLVSMLRDSDQSTKDSSMITYWAHSSETGGSGTNGWQPLAEHLEAVAEIACQLAALARPDDLRLQVDARLAGLLHDFGKYSDKFQRRLTAQGPKCQHAIHGAVLAAGEMTAPLHPLISLAVVGHHAGIPDWLGSESSLVQKLKKDAFRSEAKELRPRAAADSTRLQAALAALEGTVASQPIDMADADLYTRMLFSCLIDADRLNSAGRKPEQTALRAAEKLKSLLGHIERLRQTAIGSSIQTLRDQVLNNCLAAAERAQSLFSLSVPTGGGKTLAAMAFALKRASLFPDQVRRIVVVIPYLSIIEQNARIYTNIFGADEVLEHHSGSTMPLKSFGEDVASAPRYIASNDEEDEQVQDNACRRETENWDAPIVVTTSTRFFESLFSNRPKDLRRVHNIARSIVILDEVQTLPRRLLAPLLQLQKELANRWGVTFVFSTATQPAFEEPESRANSLLWKRGTLTEIVREPETLRRGLVRAHIEWRIGDREKMSWDQVAALMIDREQCLAVVNLRDHARELYELLLTQVPGLDKTAGIFHLSTRMCAAHRLRAIDAIRKRLRLGLACRVVSTQLIEAGVDLDFPLVLRALAPLDAIVQAAGRADREGRITARLGKPGGEVLVFRPEDERMPPHEYKEAAGVTESLAKQRLEDGSPIQVDDAAAMRDFYERYYAPGDSTALGAKFNAMRQRLQFATLAEEFEFINSRTRDVFVPDDDAARAAIAELDRIGQLTGALRRSLQRHTVGLNPTEFEKAQDAGIVRELRSGSEIWIAGKGAYSEQLGLNLTPGPDFYFAG